MDVLTAIPTIIGCAQKIYEYLEKTKHASQEKQGYREDIQTIIDSLDGLRERLQVAPGKSLPKALQKLCRPVKRFEPAKENHDDESSNKRFRRRVGDTFIHLGLGRLVPKEKQSLAGGTWHYEERYESAGPLKRLEDLLKELLDDTTQSHGFREPWDKATWFWTDPGIKDKIATMSRQREYIELLVNEADRDEKKEDRVVAKHTNRGVVHIEEIQSREARDKERKDILTWLSPLQTAGRHDTLYRNTFPASRWLVESAEYQAWLTSGHKAYLWLYGEEGCGKTILITQIAEHLRPTDPKKKVLVLQLYIDPKEQDAQTVDNLVGSLVKQTIQNEQFDVHSKSLRDLYHKARDETKPVVEDMMRVLMEEFRRYDCVFLLIDGWDSWLNVADRRKIDLDKRLRTLTGAEGNNVRTMVTSRSAEAESATYVMHCMKCMEPDLKLFWFCPICANSQFCLRCNEKGFSCRRTGHTMIQPDRIHVRMQATTQQMQDFITWAIGSGLSSDDERFIDSRIGSSLLSTSSLDRILERRPALRDQIPKAFASASQGNYLKARSYVEDIMYAQDPDEVESFLQAIPVDLAAIFEATMKKFSEMRGEKRKKLLFFALFWIITTRRPLSLGEMQHAYDMKVAVGQYVENYKPCEQDLTLHSGGIIKVEFDKSKVRFDNHSRQDFFTMPNNMEKYFSPEHGLEQSRRILTCLNYELCQEPVPQDDPSAIDHRLEEIPLLAYATQYWYEHIDPRASDPETRQLLLSFLSHEGKVATSMQVNDHLGTSYLTGLDVRKGLNGLHLAAFHGLDDLIPDLVKTHKIEVDSVDPYYGQTALMYACRNGYSKAVERLLEHKASLDICSKRGLTALFEVYQYQEGLGDDRKIILQQLLSVKENDINARTEQELGRTILMLASAGGDDETVGMVLHHPDLDINAIDNNGHSALSLAVSGKHLGVVELLLSNSGIDVETPNYLGETSLAVAADSHHIEIADALLSKGADQNAIDMSGSTPLFHAASSGKVNMFDIFLKHGGSISQRDKKCRSLLHEASIWGHIELMQHLIDSGVQLDARASRQQTALHDACRNGQIDAAKLLLDKGADKTLQDASGRTPLLVARQNASTMGHHHIMNLLDPSPDGDEPYEQIHSHAHELPLWSLARINLFDEIEQRSKRGSLHPLDTCPDTGNTALHYTVVNPVRLKILKFILDTGIPQTCTNALGQTALHLAAEGDKPMRTQVLLNYPDAPLDAKDAFEQTPLQVAQRKGYHDVAVYLIKAGATIESDDLQRNQATFIEAVEMCEANVARELIKNGADSMRPAPDGRTPKQMAQNNNDEKMLKVLEQHRSFFVPVRSPPVSRTGSGLDAVTKSGSGKGSVAGLGTGTDIGAMKDKLEEGVRVFKPRISTVNTHEVGITGKN